LKGSDTPEADQKTLFKAQIIFWMLGATDGHAKNFSIRLAPGGRFRLTPLYGIISTQPSQPASLEILSRACTRGSLNCARMRFKFPTP
jgi:serine/threonine-protein kinase HipA